MTGTWQPLRTTRHYGRPQPGWLIAHRHHVLTVEAVIPDETWVAPPHTHPSQVEPNRPYTVHVTFAGGPRPDGFDATDTCGLLDIPAGRWQPWDVYPPDGRWPQCSCCGEPMPCRTELQDRAVAAGLDRIAKLEAIPPGACWACQQPVSHRQAHVEYPGENLYLPGREPPVFHMRRSCRPSAESYEHRWVAADPRRERILTWPSCGGTLIVHHDGTSECTTQRGPFGDDHTTTPDCQGHLTHNHSLLTACYVQGEWFTRRYGTAACDRGCSPEGHPGTYTSPRPVRRDRPTQPELTQETTT